MACVKATTIHQTKAERERDDFDQMEYVKNWRENKNEKETHN
jgi:hypothetical protein